MIRPLQQNLNLIRERLGPDLLLCPVMQASEPSSMVCPSVDRGSICMACVVEPFERETSGTESERVCVTIRYVDKSMIGAKAFYCLDCAVE
jgi:hypothetical protein